MYHHHYQQTQRRLTHIHELIRTRATGTPAQFARKVGVSRATLYRLLDDLRSMGALIKYSR